jgi:uncharacterized protein YbjT (DUF2867 family)
VSELGAAPATRTVIVVGATGLVGGECLRLLLRDPAFSRVFVLARRPPVVDDPAGKLETHLVDFDHLEATAAEVRADTIICALGTTIKQAGSQERFRHVDLDYPLAVAKLGLGRGASHFLLVSALGADSKSKVFYSRTKGGLEDRLRALGYRSLTILRPSLLLGERRESRLGEELGKRFGVLVPGRYRPVKASVVARALVLAAKEDRPGVEVLESEEIRARVRKEG